MVLEKDEDEDGNTTHFVVVDKDGMMVSATNTISQFWGSGIYINGFFLNNQLRNFAQSKISPNSVEAGKQPRSYLSPTILVKNGKPVLGIGTPGGERIPAIISQVIINYVYGQKKLQDAVITPRFFFEKNNLFLDWDPGREEINYLKNLGYNPIIKERAFHASVQVLSINHEEGFLEGGADPYRSGTWKIED